MSQSKTNSPTLVFDKYTAIGEIALSLRGFIGKSVIVLSAIVICFSAYLIFYQKQGGWCLLLSGISSILALNFWKRNGVGLPTYPMLVIQHFVIYTLPIFNQDDLITAKYADSLLTKAGIEIAVFQLILGCSWLVGMRLFSPSPARAYILVDLVREGTKNLSILGFRLLAGSTSYVVLQRSGVLDLILSILPAGTQSIVNTLSSAVSSCGFFLVALNLGNPETTKSQKIQFWLLLLINCVLSAVSLLLSTSGIYIFSTAIGLIWSTGRLPIKFMAVVLAVLSFFNLGKYEMRYKYWEIDGEMNRDVSIGETPQFYLEWTQSSMLTLTSPNIQVSKDSLATRSESSLSLTQRINSLQNLLYVIEAVEINKYPLLDGKTYSIIPPLLIPRIFWPEKPRTHEGQVLLNVHFGRQDLTSTYKAYIAWGLLPEAYGNFGSIYGSVFLGAILGILCAWTEKFTIKKPIMSVEGFCAFTIFLGMVSSFEMVSSVLVTTIFQAIIPIVAATMPFSSQINLKSRVKS